MGDRYVELRTDVGAERKTETLLDTACHVPTQSGSVAASCD